MESVPSMVKEEVCVKEEPLENCADSSGASEEAAWGPELSVKGELEAGPESLPPPDAPLTDTDEKPAVLFELFEDGPTTVQSRPAAVSAVSARSVCARARQQLAMTCVVRLERLRQSQCQPCHVATDHEASLTTHMKDMHTDSAGLRAEEEACTCDTCGEHFADKMDLVDHIQTHMETSHACPAAVSVVSARSVCARARQQLAMTCVVRLERLRQSQCQPCHVATDHEASLTTHMKDMHTDSAGLRAEEEACTCDTCGEHFADKMDLVDHIQTHMGTTYSCKICSLEFSCKILFSEHSRTHKTPKVYSCNICSKVFSCKYNLNRHGAVHTGRRPYSCDICNKCFTQKGDLMAHMRIHTGQKPYKCEICNKGFTVSGSLKNHIKIHTGQKPYKCEICKKQFTVKSNLNNHLRIHTGQKPYKCEVCNKQFKQKAHLDTHSRIHTGQKPYQCEICNKQFTQNCDLTNHTRIHTGQKPFKCEICNKQFTQNSDLTKHIRIHTGQKPYKCDVCNKRFTESGTLKTHIRIHTGQKPYQCGICNKRFTYKSTLQTHMRVHAGQKP